MTRVIDIRKHSIVSLDVDVVVNAANESLAEGGGVCGAIFKAAGSASLQKACDALAPCKTGNAVITDGFHLKAKYVIHAVGPRWCDGNHNEDELLRNAYTSALNLAWQYNCRSIGFPLISAGIFGYPIQRAWMEALEACADFLDKHIDCKMDIIFAVIDDEVLKEGLRYLRNSSASSYKIATKDDWETEEMPTECESFELQRTFTQEQMDTLRRGNIPQAMEDKWFWYMDGDTLYAHRSWTGILIYIVAFHDNGVHQVTVNRNTQQHRSRGVEDDRNLLNGLLDWWVQPKYDYYHEWLSETLEAIQKPQHTFEQLQIDGKTADAVFFHKPEEPYGFLSNWYPSVFEVDGKKFTSAEQFIMYRKCMLFGDEEAAQAVMATDDVETQQSIGRKTKGYLPATWNGMRQIIAFEGLMAKFSQNEDLKQQLLETGNAYLVECAGKDKVWACGIRLSDNRRFDAMNWDGTNILGFALMEVRSKLNDCVEQYHGKRYEPVKFVPIDISKVELVNRPTIINTEESKDND